MHSTADLSLGPSYSWLSVFEQTTRSLCILCKMASRYLAFEVLLKRRHDGVKFETYAKQ